MKATSKRIHEAMIETKKKCTAGTVRVIPVEGHPEFYQVELHNNPILIGKWGEEPMFLTLAGWNTVTTVSRINDLTPGHTYVMNRDYTPYLRIDHDICVEMEHDSWYRISDCMNFGYASPEEVVKAINSKEESEKLIRLRSERIEAEMIELEKSVKESTDKYYETFFEMNQERIHFKNMCLMLKEAYIQQSKVFRELVAKVETLCYSAGVEFTSPVVADVTDCFKEIEDI